MYEITEYTVVPVKSDHPSCRPVFGEGALIEYMGYFQLGLLNLLVVASELLDFKLVNFYIERKFNIECFASQKDTL